MIGIAVELGGMISDMSKLNVTTDKRIVISKRLNFHRNRLKRDRETETETKTYVMLVFHHYQVQEENLKLLNN